MAVIVRLERETLRFDQAAADFLTTSAGELYVMSGDDRIAIVSAGQWRAAFRDDDIPAGAELDPAATTTAAAADQDPAPDPDADVDTGSDQVDVTDVGPTATPAADAPVGPAPITMPADAGPAEPTPTPSA